MHEELSSYMEELNYCISMRRRTTEARQRIAYIQAEMEDTRNGELRSDGNTEGRKHFL